MKYTAIEFHKQESTIFKLECSLSNSETKIYLKDQEIINLKKELEKYKELVLNYGIQKLKEIK